MKRSFSVLVALAFTLTFIAPAFADSVPTYGIAPKTPEQERLYKELVTTIDVPSFEQEWKAVPGKVRNFSVDCDAGQALAPVLARTARKMVVTFSGTCTEDVVIERDFTTLVGSEGAQIVGSLTVNDSTSIFLQGFSVTGSAARGIALQEGTSATLVDVSASNNGLQGLFLASSNALLVNGVFSDNVADGIAVTRGSELLMTGGFETNRNGSGGVLAFASSTVFGSNFALEANGNAIAGIVVQVVSSGTFVGGTIVANDNGVAGLLLASNGVVTEGFTSTTLNGNGLGGGALTDSASWLTFVGAGVEKVMAGNLEYGIRAESDSTVDFRGETNVISVVDNLHAGIGLVNASGRFEGTTANNNVGPDLIVYFGAQGIIFGVNDIEDVFCGPGSMIDSRDDVSGFDSTGFVLCPDEAPAAAAKRRFEMQPIGVVPVR